MALRVVMGSSCPFGGQLQIESGTHTQLRLGADASTVAIDDTLGDGQSQPVSATIVGAVQALEGLEQLVGVVGVEAASVVAYTQLQNFPFDSTGNLNAHDVLIVGELPRVVQQLNQQ